MHVERPPRVEARSAIVLLHSRAGDEHEVRPLLEEIDPEARHLGLFPLGPLFTDEGRHWYAIEQEAEPEPETFRPTLAALESWLDEALAARRIPLDRIVVGGFSQGAAMAYALALGPGRPSPGALVAFSGYIPRVDGFDLELDGRAGLRVAIAHGTGDDSVRIDFAREARERLGSAGLAVRYLEEPGGHEITAGAISQARAVIEDAVGASP